MEVKPGFKRTEVGIIPEDWDVSSVGQEFEIKLGKMLDAARNTGVLKPYLGNRAIQWDRIDITNLPTVPMSRTDIEKYRLREGDLLVCEGGEVGRAAIWEAPISECYYQKALHRLRPLRGFNSRIMAALLRQWSDRGVLKNYVTQTSIAHLPREKFMEVPMPVPPVLEQCAIATALSNVDALLGGLDMLIAKKRDLKQAAMQQLLTGKTRLQGFSEEWKVKSLEEIGEISGAGVDKKIRPNEPPVRLLNYMDIYKKDFMKSVDFEHEVSARPDQVRRCAVQRGDVFFTPTSEVRDDIGHSAVAMEDIHDVVYSYHVVRLRIFEDWDVRFRNYVFKTKHFIDQASTQCEGSGTRYVITLPKFRSITVKFPTDTNEQTAIATVFSDMDAELTALKARREKTRLLKQGMMQELLTGRVRLV